MLQGEKVILRSITREDLVQLCQNLRAIRAYLACGFVEEGRLRKHVWHDGTYVDLVYMGILKEEWHIPH